VAARLSRRLIVRAVRWRVERSRRVVEGGSILTRIDAII
jgi:hypothetical protein